MATEAIRVLTIGVYGWEEAAFFQALLDHNVDVFCDVRARRGVRGSTYTFANSKRLQAALADRGIKYMHFKELAPSKQIRDQQAEADKASGIAKRKRTELGEVFVTAYAETILRDVNAEAFLTQFNNDVKTLCLFCVEREPAACHRSLLADHLARKAEIEVKHIVP